jgi:CRP-like cAMP-binding protein
MTPHQLASLPLFADVPNAELARLIKICRVVNFTRGEVIFQEGENADRALLVVEGNLRASTVTTRGHTVLNTVKAGKLVGESGLMVQAEVRSATLTADSAVYALEIRRKHLEQLHGTDVLAGIQMSILKATASRLRKTQDQMNTLVQQKRSVPVPVRPKQTTPSQAPGIWRSFLNALGGLA